MGMQITMKQTRYGAAGALLTLGNTYTVSDAFGAEMVGAGFADNALPEAEPVLVYSKTNHLIGVVELTAGGEVVEVSGGGSKSLDRLPGIADNASKGYNTSSVWQHGGNISQPITGINTQQAAWQRQPIQGATFSAVMGAATIGCFGLVAMKAGYVGPAADISVTQSGTPTSYTNTPAHAARQLCQIGPKQSPPSPAQ